MAFTPTDTRSFFGMDTRQWRAVGGRLAALPALRWLQPTVRVALRQSDGRQTAWDVVQGVATPARGATERAPAKAIELPLSRVLERRLTLPPLSPADVEQAVQLDVAAASPFGAEQSIHGYAASPLDNGSQRVDVAITSRQEVDEALCQAGADLGNPPEVWVLPAARDADGAVRPLVMRGYGEAERERVARQGLATRLGLLALALALLLALAFTPTLLVRHRSLQAQASFEALQRQAAPQVAQREALMQRLERLQAVDKVLSHQLAMPPVLDMLTRAVPDGAWLTSIRVEGNKLVLNGNADDAAALVQRLAKEPGVRDARLASPATRGFGANKETFIIEMHLDADRYGLGRATGVPAS